MASPFSEEDLTTALMSLVAWAGNASAAARYLKSEKGISVSVATLCDWKVRHGERYDELREKYQAQLEGNLAHELRDCARLAVEVERLALEKTRERLEAGKERDPSRAAANLAMVAAKSTDKLMTLTARPTQITENRDATEILRSLVARGVLTLPDEEPPKEIEGSAE